MRILFKNSSNVSKPAFLVNANVTNGTVSLPHSTVEADDTIRKNLSPLYLARYPTILITLISLYIFAVLLCYEVKYGKRKLASFINLVHASGFCAVVCCLSQVIELWFPETPILCSVHGWINISSVLLGLTLTYTVLWDRQRKLYSDPRLCQAISVQLRVLSAVCIIGVYVAAVAIGYGYHLSVYEHEYVKSPAGCVEAVPHVVSGALLACVLAIVATSVFQFLLLFLIVYPLTKNKENETKLPADIRSLVKRLVGGVAICIVTNLFAQTFMILQSFRVVNYVPSNFTALDLITNVIAVVVSFRNWKVHLLPMFYHQINDGA